MTVQNKYFLKHCYKILPVFSLLLIAGCAGGRESMNEVAERGLRRSVEQSKLMAEELKDKEGRLPKSVKDGRLVTCSCYDWVSGFFPGVLWYLYEDTQDPSLRAYAELYTARLEKVQHVRDNHDVGFMLYCSYGNGYRLTKNPDYKKILLTGAKSLSTRYSEIVGSIRSWDFRKEVWQYPVIIDNMMNLELLSWAQKNSGDAKFMEIAKTHADTTIKNHFRDDFSSYHVVSYDKSTGKPHLKATWQGYADASAWSRGQAWGLYGYTMMARETGEARYLDQARGIAKFLLSHPRMPEDKVPYWDYDAPNIPNAPRDASAAAIMASALIELSTLVPSAEGEKYFDFACAQLRSLSSPEYLAAAGTNNNFILMHGTGHLPGNSEIDVPLSYADYYYVESLLRLKEVLADDFRE